MRRVSTDAPSKRNCDKPACVGMYLRTVGWARGGNSIWFVKLESSLNRSDGVPRDMSGLYEWNLKSGEVRTILRQPGLLEECRVVDITVYCMDEQPTRPRRIVAVNFDSRRVVTLADPNPMLTSKKYPTVHEIIIKDSQGNIGFAQVVYPNNYVKGERYPLVVAQYDGKGYLRGQVGNETPIFPLAADGFVVMSVEWPRFTELEKTGSYDEWNKKYAKEGRDLIWGAIEGGIDQLIADGLVDPKRMAITGLSGGAELVNYIIQRSDRFAAAVASSGTADVTFFALASEDGDRERLMRTWETQSVMPAPDSRLYDLAWSNKPEKLVTPFMINVGEYEALVGFEGISAIRTAGGPIEVRIFPDEQHIKYHPVSIQGTYENSMQWLKFWLQDKEDSLPKFKTQYERWRAMRDRQKARTAGSPALSNNTHITSP
jgi:dipeptidyl aminopeptidase/acylaminoacyl peptidase